MKTAIKSYTDKKLKKDFSWRLTIFYFSLCGIYESFYLKKDVILALDGNLFSKSFTVITYGILFGIITKLSIGYLIKITSKFFNSESKIKDILKALMVSFKPHLITITLVFIHLAIAEYFDTDTIQDNRILVAVFMLLINAAGAILWILSIVILFYGLKSVQNQTLGKTILNYLIASLIFSPIYFVLMKL